MLRDTTAMEVKKVRNCLLDLVDKVPFKKDLFNWGFIHLPSVVDILTPLVLSFVIIIIFILEPINSLYFK